MCDHDSAGHGSKRCVCTSARTLHCDGTEALSRERDDNTKKGSCTETYKNDGDKSLKYLYYAMLSVINGSLVSCSSFTCPSSSWARSDV